MDSASIATFGSGLLTFIDLGPLMISFAGMMGYYVRLSAAF